MKKPKKNSATVHPIESEAKPWLEWLAAEGRSPLTIKDYRYVVGWFARFLKERGGPGRVRDVRTEDLVAWQQRLFREKYSPITVGCYVHPLLGLFGWLEKRGEIFLNPCHTLEMPDAPRRLMPVPSEAQMLRLVNSVNGSSPIELRDQAILEVAYSCGFRCRELVGLDLEMVNLGEGLVQVVGKGGSERKGILTQAATRALQRYLDHGRPKLCDPDRETNALWLGNRYGRRIGAASLREIVKSHAKAVGLEIVPHAIRRAFATHLLRNGATPIQLRRLLGHISYRSLKHYLRYAPEELFETHRRSCLGQ
jgi:site-specific recombinase XerD